MQEHPSGRMIDTMIVAAQPTQREEEEWLFGPEKSSTHEKFDSIFFNLTLTDMEYSMRLVEKHCSKYLLMFGECMQLHPHTWQIDCDLERRKLAKCAETNPEIVHIKTVCGKQFHIYESCMAEFQSDPEKCTAFFNVFSACAQEALKTYGLPQAPNADESSP